MKKGKTKVACAPFTYWNRILLKQCLKKEPRTAAERKRPSGAGTPIGPVG
jgi:hypothetical protein